MIAVTIDMDKELQKIEKMLGDLAPKSKNVLVKAINATAKQARKELANTAQEAYAVRTARFNKAMTIQNANTRHLDATIKTTGEVMELIDFKASPSSPATGGARPDITKGKVLQSGNLKALQMDNLKAFVVKFKSGHVSVAQRVPGKKMQSDPSKDFLKKLLSPSIPTMIGSEKNVYGIVKPLIQTNLEANIQTQIKKLLEASS